MLVTIALFFYCYNEKTCYISNFHCSKKLVEHADNCF